MSDSEEDQKSIGNEVTSGCKLIDVHRKSTTNCVCVCVCFFFMSPALVNMIYSQRLKKVRMPLWSWIPSILYPTARRILSFWTLSFFLYSKITRKNFSKNLIKNEDILKENMKIFKWKGQKKTKNVWFGEVLWYVEFLHVYYIRDRSRFPTKSNEINQIDVILSLFAPFFVVVVD